MARAAVAAALFLFLTVAFANPSDRPPVDEDGSGDDEDDSFSGSGYEPSLEEFAHTANASKPTEASLATTLSNSPTENQHPLVEEPGSPEEKEAGTVSTTAAVETEKLIPSPGQPEPDVPAGTVSTTAAVETEKLIPSPGQPEPDVPAEETVTDPGSAVVLVPTTLPTIPMETVKMYVAGDASPEGHNIPPVQTTESVRHAVDPVVDPSHQDGATTTEAIEPHKHHHHHHHHHRTTAASVTEAVDTDLHHVLHQGTSAPSVTPGLDLLLHPDIQDDTSPTSTDPHMHHPHDADQVTESNVHAHPATQDANLIEKDSAINTTTTRASYDEGKMEIPIIGFENESEPERTDSPEFEGSGEGVDANDFVFEPSIPRAQAPDNTIAVEDDGTSDKSKGIMEQKGVLAAVIAGGVAGLVFAVCLVGFMLYRMKKKDEGSYCLEETKQTNGGYEKPLKQEEFYA